MAAVGQSTASEQVRVCRPCVSQSVDHSPQVQRSSAQEALFVEVLDLFSDRLLLTELFVDDAFVDRLVFDVLVAALVAVLVEERFVFDGDFGGVQFCSVAGSGVVDDVQSKVSVQVRTCFPCVEQGPQSVQLQVSSVHEGTVPPPPPPIAKTVPPTRKRAVKVNRSRIGKSDLSMSRVAFRLYSAKITKSSQSRTLGLRPVQGKHEAIITKELFDLAQAQLTRDQIVRGSKEFAFTKLFTCGYCQSGISAEGKYKPLKDG